jgi:hypothetical protein
MAHTLISEINSQGVCMRRLGAQMKNVNAKLRRHPKTEIAETVYKTVCRWRRPQGENGALINRFLNQTASIDANA